VQSMATAWIDLDSLITSGWDCEIPYGFIRPVSYIPTEDLILIFEGSGAVWCIPRDRLFPKATVVWLVVYEGVENA
jgi:hypothetical protein